MKKILSILVICLLTLFIAGCTININSSDDNTDTEEKDIEEKEEKYDDKLTCSDNGETLEIYFEDNEAVLFVSKYEAESEDEAKDAADLYKNLLTMDESTKDVKIETDGKMLIMTYPSSIFSEKFEDLSKSGIKSSMEENGYVCK